MCEGNVRNSIQSRLRFDHNFEEIGEIILPAEVVVEKVVGDLEENFVGKGVETWAGGGKVGGHSLNGCGWLDCCWFDID